MVLGHALPREYISTRDRAASSKSCSGDLRNHGLGVILLYALALTVHFAETGPSDSHFGVYPSITEATAALSRNLLVRLVTVARDPHDHEFERSTAGVRK